MYFGWAFVAPELVERPPPAHDRKPSTKSAHAIDDERARPFTMMGSAIPAKKVPLLKVWLGSGRGATGRRDVADTYVE